MIKWLKQFWFYESRDIAKHRQYTTKYEDLCM